MTELPHKDFAIWYKTIDLGDDVNRIQSRGAGAQAILDNIEYEQCQSLVGVMLGQADVLEGTGGDLIKRYMTESDPTFPTSGNDLEMSGLAEIILAMVLDKDEVDELAGYTAGLVISALGGGVRDYSTITDIVERAKNAARTQGVLARKRDSLSAPPKSFTPALDFDDCFEESTNMGDINQAKTVLKKVAGKIARQFGSVAKTARSERKILERQLSIQDEELDLLWWAANGQSDTNGTLFSEMPPAQRSLIAPVEAANRTQLQPGISSIRGLLQKAGLSPKKTLSVDEAINAAEIEWLRSIRIAKSTIQTPLHFAIEQRLLSPEDATWSAHWSSITKIPADAKMKEIDLAELFYQERLVLDAFGDV